MATWQQCGIFAPFHTSTLLPFCGVAFLSHVTPMSSLACRREVARVAGVAMAVEERVEEGDALLAFSSPEVVLLLSELSSVA